MTDARIDTILHFWFGDSPDDAEVARTQQAFWFRESAATDRACRDRFAGDLARAAAGELDGWAATPHGRVALVMLLDQFSRNIHRGTARAFAQDAAALALTRAGLVQGHDLALRPIARVFLYLPLEHAEDPGTQDESVARFAALAADVPAAWQPAFAIFVEYAEQHRDLIRRFGRFPARNQALGRPSTAEEIAFLRAPLL